VKSSVLPVGLRLSGLRCLVVGSGAEALPRARALKDAGAHVRVVSASPSPELSALRGVHGVEFFERAFSEADFDGVWLAVLTDLDRSLAERMFLAASSRYTFFCAVDQPQFCTFSHLALAREGDVTLAISTNGKAPALARRLREELARVLAEANLGAFVARLAELRERTASVNRRQILGDAVKRVRFSGKLELPEDEG
jgi:siroheme synthase-like protein